MIRNDSPSNMILMRSIMRWARSSRSIEFKWWDCCGQWKIWQKYDEYVLS